MKQKKESKFISLLFYKKKRPFWSLSSQKMELFFYIYNNIYTFFIN